MGDCDDPTFSLAQIFQRIRNNHHAASWLLSKQPGIPTIITSSMLQASITADMSAWTQDQTIMGTHTTTSNKHHATTLLRKVQHACLSNEIQSKSVGSTSSSSTDTPYTLALALKDQDLTDPETVVYVVHAIHGNYAFMTCADMRIPFAFLEDATHVVPGVRRGIVETTSDDTFVCIHFWKTNGRSSMIVERYPHDVTQPSRMCFMLLAPYSTNRYPNVSDVMEVGWVKNQWQCPYCSLRGYPKCECSSLVAQRSIPTLPFLADSKNPWIMWAMRFQYEAGIKRHTMNLFNFQKRFGAKAHTIFYCKPTFLGNNIQEHRRGFQQYLNAIRPLYTNQMGRFGAAIMPAAGHEGACGAPNHPRSSIEEIPGQTVSEEQLLDNMPCLKSLDQLIDQALDVEPLKMDSINILSFPSSTINQHSPQVNQCIERNKSPTDASPIYGLVDSQTAKSLPQAECVLASCPIIRTDISNPATLDKAPSSKKTRIITKHDPATETERQAALDYMAEIDTMNLHHDVRCSCKICGTWFTRKYDLKRHVKTTHLNEREFSCSQCCRKFKRIQHVDIHIRLVHQKGSRNVKVDSVDSQEETPGESSFA